MIGSRVRHSLAQFLELQAPAVSLTLFSKNGVQHLSLESDRLLGGLLNIVRGLDPRVLMFILEEVVATHGDLRSRVEPRYRFDERYRDLRQCLLLDGYDVQEFSAEGALVRRLVRVDPAIGDGPPVEDELRQALRTSSLPRALDVLAMIDASDRAYRAAAPDYNAALTNARVALETLAADFAAAVASTMTPSPTYDGSKWGAVLSFLRGCERLSLKEEEGLAGVYKFLSQGAHRPAGISDAHMARLGRSFALNMCWFLLKIHGDQAKARR